MWRGLPFDLLANIFSFLPPDSLACAASACRQWHDCAKTHHPSTSSNQPLPWFIALPIRHHNSINNNNLSCYAQNPISKKWHPICLDFLPCQIRPLTSVGSLILFKTTNPTSLYLLISNPFTRKFKKLPILNIQRSNPAIGVVTSQNDFRVYAAGGTSAGSTYEPTLEVYDSRHGTWRVVGQLPVEFAVRLTVWTPNDSVFCDGVLYWITSARAYSLMGCDISSNRWREVRVPMAERLEFAAVVVRKGRLSLVGGGTCGRGASVWELGEGDKWVLVEEVPVEMGVKFVGGVKGSWASTKCVGCEGVIYLYRDFFGSGMIAWKEVEENGKWEWFWIEGSSSSSSSSSSGKKVANNLQVKGVLIPPNLGQSCLFSSSRINK